MQKIYVIFERRQKLFKLDEWEPWEFNSIANTEQVANLTCQLFKAKHPTREFDAVKVELRS